jgi:hypothetical protein
MPRTSDDRFTESIFHHMMEAEMYEHCQHSWLYRAARYTNFHRRLREALFVVAIIIGLAGVNILFAIPVILVCLWSFWHEDAVKQD